MPVLSSATMLSEDRAIHPCTALAEPRCNAESVQAGGNPANAEAGLRPSSEPGRLTSVSKYRAVRVPRQKLVQRL